MNSPIWCKVVFQALRYETRLLNVNVYRQTKIDKLHSLRTFQVRSISVNQRERSLGNVLREA